MTPITIIVGAANSGKDTAASSLATMTDGVVIAQADPMKRFMATVFEFSEDQLWGPSQARNAVDERYIGENSNWIRAAERFTHWGRDWLDSIEMGNYGDHIFGILRGWFKDLRLSTRAQGLSPRAALQSLGTEFGRSIDVNVWSNLALDAAEELLLGGKDYRREIGIIDEPGVSGFAHVIISDGRFRNEILNVLDVGGQAIKVVNPDDKPLVGGIDGHVSESELKAVPDSWFDFIITNDKSRGLENLRNQLQTLISIKNPVRLGI